MVYTLIIFISRLAPDVQNAKILFLEHGYYAVCKIREKIFMSKLYDAAVKKRTFLQKRTTNVLFKRVDNIHIRILKLRKLVVYDER